MLLRVLRPCGEPRPGRALRVLRALEGSTSSVRTDPDRARVQKNVRAAKLGTGTRKRKRVFLFLFRGFGTPCPSKKPLVTLFLGKWVTRGFLLGNTVLSPGNAREKPF